MTAQAPQPARTSGPTLTRALVPAALILMLLLNVVGNVRALEEIRTRMTVAPGATLSDLYPRWLGTRDLLLHGTNPYSEDERARFERGFYGAPRPSASWDKLGYQGYDYPLYLSVLIAPLALLPFDVLQPLATLALLALVGWAAFAWSGAVGWPRRRRSRWYLVCLTAGSYPGVFLALWQQPSGLVAGGLVAAGLAFHRRRYALAGALFAVTLIKPQLALLPLAGVTILALKQRCGRRFLLGFASAFGALLAASLVMLPSWPIWFLRQLKTYQEQNALWGISNLLPAGPARILALAGIVGGTLAACAFVRRGRAETSDVRYVLSLTITATLIVNPAVLLYNAALLVVPALFLIGILTGHGARVVRLPARSAVALMILAFVGTTPGAFVPELLPLPSLGLVFAAIPAWIALMSVAWFTRAGATAGLPDPGRLNSAHAAQQPALELGSATD